MKVLQIVGGAPAREPDTFWSRLTRLSFAKKVELAAALIMIGAHIAFNAYVAERYGFSLQMAGALSLSGAYALLVWHQDLKPNRRR